MIRFTCPQCKQPLQHPTANETATCPKCLHRVRVPTPTLLSAPYIPPPPPQQDEQQFRAIQRRAWGMPVVIVVSGLLLVMCCLGSGGTAVWYFVRQSSPQHLIVGEWETTFSGQFVVLNFHKDGTLATTSQGARITGKYRIVGMQSVDIEFANQPFGNNKSLAGTCTVAFPDNNRMILTAEGTGVTADFRRVIR
jgi:hypothetical protein